MPATGKGRSDIEYFNSIGWVRSFREVAESGRSIRPSARGNDLGGGIAYWNGPGGRPWEMLTANAA